jgi:chemotaxis protein CheX
VLDLPAAGRLATALLAVRGQDVELDASQVTRLGGQCLQVLLSALETWRADGCALSVVQPTTEFISGLKLLGVDQRALVRGDHP